MMMPQLPKLRLQQQLLMDMVGMDEGELRFALQLCILCTENEKHFIIHQE